MKHIIHIIITIALVGIMVLSLCACTPAERVNHNLNQEADKFNCLRRITVYNARTDLIILEVEGYMSLSNNTSNELVVTCKTAEDVYKKNYIYLNDYVIYVVEDITGLAVDPYHYKVEFYTGPQFDYELHVNTDNDFKVDIQ